MAINMHYAEVQLILGLIILLGLVGEELNHGSKKVSIKDHALLVPVAEMSKDLTLALFLDDHGPLLSVLWTRCLVLDLDLKDLQGLQAEEGLHSRLLWVI